MSQPPRRPANGAENDGSVASDTRNGVGAAQAAMSRAEKFEDEKRRFIESCFSKKDNDGSGALFRF
jgi:exocyst complex component 1